MSRTSTMMEINAFEKEELDSLSKLSCKEIWKKYHDTIFFLMDLQLEIDDRYEEIIPYCAPITTADGEKLYVAKLHYHLISSDSIIYNSMKEYSDEENPRYADITDLIGEEILGSEPKFEGGEYVGHRKINYQIPHVQEGGRLFYKAG